LLNEDYRDMLRLLSGNRVRFLVVGAYAMGVHGYPRATGDIDIWVEPTLENSRLVYRALATFGAAVDQITPDTFMENGIVFQIGVAPRRIDIITGISGVEFDSAYTHRQTIDLDGLAVPVLSHSDLIRNKRASGRPKDYLDADRLENPPE
jgi:hypothetical protein